MDSLRVEICNERLLPRFGVDRLLVLLGRHLAQSGHQVIFTSLRCDRSMLDGITRQVNQIEVPPGLDMAGTEAYAMASVAHRWEQQAPNVVVIGGWPFFEVAARASRFEVGSIFIDAGAVAQDAIPQVHLPVQLELRRIRQLTLPRIDRILPISDFIRDTQSEADRGSLAGIHSVLLGADHMDLQMVHGLQGSEAGATVERIELLSRQGEHLVLLLGRFEAAGYKNSAQAYELLRRCQKKLSGIRLLLLDAGQNCDIPVDLRGSVELLGAPDDDALQSIMQLCAAGVGMSLWEGFNLPLAEMQWLGRPALVFGIGAHPEVVADPWLLCETVNEMADKLVAVLQNKVPVDLDERIGEFRKKRSWKTTLAAWEDEIVGLSTRGSSVEVLEQRARRVIIADVSNASLDPANPGVIRVARRLCAQLHENPELEMVFAAWDRESKHYLFLNERRRGFLELFGGPKDGLGLLATCGREVTVEQFIAAISGSAATGPVLFMPETMFDGEAAGRMLWAQGKGFKTAAILYDLIPVFHQELCDANVTSGFPAYLEALTKTDAIWSISQQTLNDLSHYVRDAGFAMPRSAEVVNLPGQFAQQPRRNGANPGDNAREIRIVCVSTLEPRKNHLRLLQAYELLRSKRSDLSLRLVLIGNRYAGAPQIVEQVQAASKRDPSIEWYGIVDDDRLASELIRADFTVYPSLIEGYGLPILESLWLGRPCLTHCEGVMRELASEGGCITADMTNVEAIRDALERLCTDVALRTELAKHAATRHIMTWTEYGIQIAERLINL